MRYLQVSIRCQRAAGDAVGNLLAELSGAGYAIEDPQDVADLLENRTKGGWDLTDLVPGDPAWVTVKGWLSDTEGLEQAQLQLAEGLAHIRQLDLGTVEPPGFAWVQEEDWANAWRAYFKPLQVGDRLVIIPSWEEYALRPNQLPLYLDPGMAFGTGTHATTSLCLRWLETLVKPGSYVLDVGTGSGILAIAAARLGAAKVVAVDIDPVAVGVAAANAAKNHVTIEVRQATIDQVEPVEVDLVVANIIASVISDILPDVASRMKHGGRFLASGIIAEKKQAVIEAMTSTWLLPLEVREEGGWVAILAART